MSVDVRKAIESDVEWLMGRLQDFAQFFDAKKLVIDEAYARFAIPVLMKEHLFLIAERPDVGRIGFMCGLVSSHIFNPKLRVLQEMFWWVDPGYRGTRAGTTLLDAFLDWGKRNVDWITFALQDKHASQEAALFSRGFHLRERSYLIEVQ